MPPMNAKNTASPARFATVNGARANSDTSISGDSCRSSQATNAASAQNATTNAPRINPESQPRPGPSMIANVSSPIPVVVRNAPVQSNRAPSSDRAITGMNRTPRAITTSAIGTLSRNTERQPMASTNSPPTAGPSASASPEPDDHTPIAPARARGSSNVAEMIARLVGVTIAGPSPWITRPQSSQPTEGATPPTSE